MKLNPFKRNRKPIRVKRGTAPEPIVGPPLPDGIWEVTPRPADALDDARVSVRVPGLGGSGEGRSEGCSVDRLRQIQSEKHRERGGFKRGHVLYAYPASDDDSQPHYTGGDEG